MLTTLLVTLVALATLHGPLVAQEVIEYRSEEGKYAIRLPGAPSRSDTGPLRTIVWHSVEGSYSVSVARVKAYAGSAEETVAKMADAAARAMRCQVREKRAIRLGEHPGMELMGSFTDRKLASQEGEGQTLVRWRLYLRGESLLQVMAQGRSSFVVSPRTGQVFDSLSLLP